MKEVLAWAVAITGVGLEIAVATIEYWWPE